MNNSMDQIGVAELTHQQLLDTSTNFDNFQNLSYFIKEYKKALYIISQCENFYQNFLRSKLYTISDLNKFDNINFIDLKLDTDRYKKHCDDLAKFIIRRKFENELKKVSKVYEFSFKKNYEYNTSYGYHETKHNLFLLTRNKQTILGDELLYFLGGHVGTSEKIIYTRVYNENNDLYDHKVVHKYADKEYIKSKKLIPTKVYAEDWDYETKTYKTKKENNKPVIYDFYEYSDEDEKLINFIIEFNKENNIYELKNKIFVNPENYLNEWNKYLKFINKYISDDEKYDKYMYDPDVERKIEEDKKVADIFCPAVYNVYEKNHFNKTAYDSEKFFVTARTKYIEAYKYLNKKYLQLWIDYKKDDANAYKDNYIPKTFVVNEDYERVYVDQLCNTFNTKLFNYLAINVPELLLKIKTDGEFNEIDFEKYHCKDYDNCFYFTLINGTPFPFAKYLSDVKIEYIEDENKLKCEYEISHKKKKYRWPSDAPYVVTTEYYRLWFDCSTNEPIYYNYSTDTHEEQVTYR